MVSIHHGHGFVQSIHEHVDQNRAHYTKMQEACKKHAERCFRVLQSRYAIVQNPSQHWLHETILDIMMACVIIHIMVIEEELENKLQHVLEINRGFQFCYGVTFVVLAARTQEIEYKDVHFTSKEDLIEHLLGLEKHHYLLNIVPFL